MLLMRNKGVVQIIAGLVLGICAWIPATAQKANIPGGNMGEPVVPSRVVERIDDTRLITLTGNTHPMARPEFDRGLADPQLPMERIQLALKRSPEQEAALEQFMAQQYDPKSPNFHHWLQPEEFGKLYGPSDSDIAAVTSWLQNHGFQIYQVNKGRVTIEFSGTAGQVQQAFHTEMHHYLVNGKTHLANDRDPQIPEALAPVVHGIASLHDFFPVHQSILGRYVRRNKKTGTVTPVDPEFSGPRPEFGFTNEEGDPQEDITPYDFATIYNLLPLWNAGITGKGQTIAISAVTDINASDVSTFRTMLGLGGFTGTINQIHNGADPGIDQGSLVENTLDTEWSGATAPDATVDVVISASTAATFGGQLSDQYIAEHPSMFTIMSASYGECEIGLGTAGNTAINAIYQQGAAAGISIFESAGDQGSTGCDNSDATTFPNPAQNGLQVNGDASSPWVTAVGGTEFTWQNFRTTYWSATNSATNLSNALGYIPEAPWNGTCTSQLYLDRLWQPQLGFTTLEQVCNNMVGLGYENFVTVTGGSGGVSSCITSTNGEFSTCGGGYPQPSWQKGVTGMPGATYRYLPDVSLFASSGFPYGFNGSAYLICVASNAKPQACDYKDNTEVIYQEVGGTSVSSPALAGIMALVQQKQNGAAQGLANPVFYKLAAKDNLTNCNSSTVAAGNACNFYDVTYGNNAQVCTTGSRNCVTNTSGDTYGVVSGYTTTTGYDQATGLGSVNATNLVNNWASVAGGSLTVSLSPTSLAFASTTEGSTSAAQTVTIKNTGTAAVTLTSETITGTRAASFLKSATTCGATLAAGATCTVSVEFKPATTGALTASLSVADSATGSPQTVALAGTGVAASTLAVSLSPTSLSFASTTEGSTLAAQLVTVKNTSTGTVTLTSETITGTNATSFLKSATTCGTTLAAGASCTVSVEFKPLAVGTLTASLSVADNATGSPQLVSLTGTGASTSPTGALQFIAVTPCRIADTRNATGAFGGPELAAAATRTFDVPQSACGIPSTAVAYSLNVTVVPIQSLGFLTIWPSGQAQPVVSTLNSDGRVKANATITPAGTNGGVDVFATDATQFILDIDGYFVPAGTSSGLQFFPLTPCRVADTRGASGALGGPSLAENDSRAFPVQSSACGIPSTARAYSLNITAVPHGSLGFLTAWPSGQAQPVVSTLNSSTGVVTANAAIVPAGSVGDVSIFVSDASDVILDVDGYFAPPATGGLSLYTVTPCRVLDTRSSSGALDGMLAVSVHGSTCAPPATARSYVLNATVVPTGSLSYLTLWAAGGTEPDVSTLNATDGAVTSNMAIVPTTNGTIEAFSTDSTQLILDISSYFAP
jgi:hypothetical protein